MLQTRVDKIEEGKFKINPSLNPKFEDYNFNKVFTKRFRNKDKKELIQDINKLKNRLKLFCIDLSKFEKNHIDYLRKLLLLLLIFNRALESSLTSENFDFSWQEILVNSLHLENDPNFMIKAMIKEIKRRNSFKATISIRKTNINENIKLIKTKQKLILNFLEKKQR